MKCSKGKINRFIDEELSYLEREKLEKHMEECSGCLHFMKELKKSLKPLKEAPPINLPEYLLPKIKRIYFSGEEKLSLAGRFIVYAGLAAVIIFAFFNILGPAGANAEIDYYIEAQLDTLFGSGLVDEVIYENNWEEELQNIIDEGEI